MIVVVGEALVDVVTRADGSSRETPGGSPLNVAVGLGRLGVRTTLLTQLGDDARGRAVVEHVRRSGATVVAAPHGSTSVARATLDPDGVASYDFDIDWSLPPQELPSCSAVHVGSLGTVLEPGRRSVVDLVEQAGRRDLLVSLDLNVRESFVPDAAAAWAAAQDLAARCTVVKLSDEDAGVLDPGREPEEVAATLLAGAQTRLVLLTRGPRGATAYTEQDPPPGGTSVRPRPVEVVDTVGAGDAFMSGALAALVGQGRPGRASLWQPPAPDGLEELLAEAVEVAALTCEREGADPPTRDELRPGRSARS